MKHRFLGDFAIVLALCLSYSTAYILNIIWMWDISYSLAIMFILSFLAAFLTELSRSILHVLVSLALSTAVTTGIVSAPPIILSRSPEVVDYAILMSLNVISKLILISVPLCLLGVIAGSFCAELIE